MPEYDEDEYTLPEVVHPSHKGKGVAEFHLGVPYAPPGAKCIYCGKVATRSCSMAGSVTVNGEKRSFTDMQAKVYLCNVHGILFKAVK